MDGRDLRDAELVLAGLPKAAREQAEVLASRLRLTGTVATLHWLRVGAENDGRGDLLRRLEEVLGIDEADRLDTPGLLALQDRTSRLADALHVLTRAQRGR